MTTASANVSENAYGHGESVVGLGVRFIEWGLGLGLFGIFIGFGVIFH